MQNKKATTAAVFILGVVTGLAIPIVKKTVKAITATVQTVNKLKEANELTDNSDMADDDYIDNDTLDDMFSNICHNVNNPEKHSISGIDVIIKTEEADKDNNADDDEIYIDDEDAAEDVETDSENDTQKE